MICTKVTGLNQTRDVVKAVRPSRKPFGYQGTSVLLMQIIFSSAERWQVNDPGTAAASQLHTNY